jgi:hypothetical protein
MKKLNFIIVTLLAIALTGCTNRYLDFTLISTKNVDLTKACNFTKGKTRVSGEDMAHIIIFIPTKEIHPKDAIDKAIESIPGCVALLDGVIRTKWYWIPYIYGQNAVIVEGTPLIDPSLGFKNLDDSIYKRVELDRKGEIKKCESISKEEFLVLKEKK